MASERSFFTPFLGALRDLLALWRKHEIQGVVIGGLAAGLLGRPRVTRDVDCLIWLEESGWASFLEAALRFHFEPRIKNALSFAGESRTLLLRHVPSQIEIDIAFAGLPFEREVIDRAIIREVNGLQVPLPTAEDLIIMKTIADRPRDIADVEGIIDCQPKIDRRRIRRVVRAFSKLLENPDLVTNLETILGRGRKKGRKC